VEGVCEGYVDLFCDFCVECAFVWCECCLVVVDCVWFECCYVVVCCCACVFAEGVCCGFFCWGLVCYVYGCE